MFMPKPSKLKGILLSKKTIKTSFSLTKDNKGS